MSEGAGVGEATPLLRRGEAWAALERHHAGIADTHLRELFAADPGAASGSSPTAPVCTSTSPSIG